MDFYTGIFQYGVIGIIFLILALVWFGSRSKRISPSSVSEADAEKWLWDDLDDEPLDLQPYQVHSPDRSKDQR